MNTRGEMTQKKENKKTSRKKRRKGEEKRREKRMTANAKSYRQLAGK
jgi:hypothetical protein